MYIQTVALAGAALACVPGALAESKPALARKRVKLGIATYSYWHFRNPKVSIETVIDKAAGLGVEGIDFLHRQMDIPQKAPLSPEHLAYLHKLKCHAFRNGRSICCLSTHLDQLTVARRPDGHR